ncbi:MAG: hypothetical protein J0H62_09405 [Rhizobiales bacterium]|nr:hypothetical protein [Hyphomicrobiales bacterium]
MLFRLILTGLVLCGGIALAGFVVTSDGSQPALPKSDRLIPANASHAAAPADPLAPLARKPVQTTSIRQGDVAPPAGRAPPTPGPSQSFNTAMLPPGFAAPGFAAVPPAPSAPQPEQRADPRKPFRCPRGTPAASGPPTTSQLRQIETALSLSPEQEKLWRPVQRALMEIARHFEEPGANRARGKQLLAVERMQQIYWMSGPFVLSLHEDQKRDARKLACTMGLGAVAALI